MAEIEIKRHHTTLVVCPLQSILDEMKTRFQRPEIWVFLLHLKDGKYLNPKKRKRNLLAVRTAACLRYAFTPVCLGLASGLLPVSFYLLVSRQCSIYLFRFGGFALSLFRV